MYNTRLNNTLNGPIHLGHIYAALVNQYAAHETGGRFIMRWDDTNPAFVDTLGAERMSNILDGQREDLEWVGVAPDAYIKQTDIIAEVKEWIAKKGVTLIPDDPLPYTPEIVHETDGIILYPLTTTLTPEKVVMDWMEGSNLIIRGFDLMTEYCLYQFFCKIFDIPEPKHIYLPRLRWGHGDMSKSIGAQSVAGLRRNGYTPKQVIEMIERACLKLPANSWKLSNLRGQPCL